MSVKKTLLYFGFATGINILQFKSFNFFFLKQNLPNLGLFSNPSYRSKSDFSGQTAAKITRKGINDVLNHHFFLLVVDIFDQFTTQNKFSLL